MILSLFEIRNINDAMRRLSKQELPVKYSWKILQFCEEFEGINKKIEDFRVELVKKYGTVIYECYLPLCNEPVIIYEKEWDESQKDSYEKVNQKIEIKDEEKLEKFLTEFNDLLSEEQEIKIKPIEISAELAEKIEMSAQDLFSLKKILTIRED